MKLAALASILVAGCVPPKGQTTQPTPATPAAAQTPATPPVVQQGRALPFDAPPAITAMPGNEPGSSAKLQASIRINRDVMPTDDVALVVRVGADVVGRFPIVGQIVQGKPTTIKQGLELPLGDYEIEIVYQGTAYAGQPFRIADVTAWGGHRQLEVRANHGTRISLREHKLWIGRWWANDGPAQPWIIEWVKDGQVVTVTSGKQEHWFMPKTRVLVEGALHAYRDTTHWQNSVWAFGEEYPIPDQVASQPGGWAARVVHPGVAPVAVMFNVGPGGKPAEVDHRFVASPDWQADDWSVPLATRPLGTSEIEPLDAKLPHPASTEPFDDEVTTGTIIPPVRMSQAAVRALYRSRQLAETWSNFLTLDDMTSVATPAAAPLHPVAAGSQVKPTEAADKDRVAKLKAMKAQIEQLVKQHGYAWKPDELPRS